MQVDASRSGNGVVLCQLHMLQSHTNSTKIYAIMEQEMLAVVFACQRFHHYFYEKKVEIETDDKPLESFMKKELQIANFTKTWYRAEVFSRKESILADAFSHASLKETAEDIAKDE